MKEYTCFYDTEIQTLYYPDKLESVLGSIYSAAQSAIQEKGTGILYLSLGFLEWFDSEVSEESYLALLFIIPVTLEKGKLDARTNQYVYDLRYSGEDILPNLSLQEKLQHDFGMGLPVLDENTSPEDYFVAVQDIIKKNQPRWQVKRYGVVSLLNFRKILMYRDLDPKRWPQGEMNILNHKIINRLFISQQSDASIVMGMSKEYGIDTIPDVHAKYPLIYDADSSQHSALVDAINGDDLVIQGAPETGKSQTITNLIAAAMLNGKKVLFVAEKLAALKVVKNKLDQAGLGDFCLELHSDKSQMKTVLDDLQKRLHNQMVNKSRTQIDAEITRYEEEKRKLNEYAEAINKKWKKTDLTIHQILTGATRYHQELAFSSSELSTLYIENLSGENLDRISQLRLQDQIKEFKNVVIDFRKKVGETAELWEHPWYGVNNIDIQPFDVDSVVKLLTEWTASLLLFKETVTTFYQKYALNTTDIDDLTAQKQLITSITQYPTLPEQIDFTLLKQLNFNNIEIVKTWLDEVNIANLDYTNIAKHIVPEKLSLINSNESLPNLNRIIQKYGFCTKMTITELVHLIYDLEDLENRFSTIYDELVPLLECLPTAISERFPATVQGFQNIAQFITIAAELPADLINARNERFDNDAMRIQIDQLCEELKELHRLSQDLDSHFALDKEMNHIDLDEVEACLHKRGLLCHVQSKWRRAQKQLKNLSKNKKADWKKLHDNLPKLKAYLYKKQNIEAKNYHNILGELFIGLNTDEQKLKQLCDWYAKVRTTWGIGFGANVIIGNTLLSAENQIFMGIQQLHTRKIDIQIHDAIELLNKCNGFFMPKIFRHDNNENLVDVGNILTTVKNDLKEHVSSAQNWFCNESIDLATIETLTHKIEAFREKNQTILGNDTIYPILGLDCAQFANFPNNNLLNWVTISKTILFSEQIFPLLKQLHMQMPVSWLTSRETYTDFLDHLSIIKDKDSNQKERREAFIQETELNCEQWYKQANNKLTLLIQRNELAQSKPEWLMDWLNFSRIIQELENNNLQNISHAVFNRTLAIDKVEIGLKAAIYDQLAREIIKEEPQLTRISGVSHMAMQKTFTEYDKKLQQLQREKIAAIIANNPLPASISGGKKSEYTGIALIQNEIGKKSRHIPIRQLVHRAGQTLLQLKPCFMMGPMSVANYLIPGEIEFDLIVMDEASQIKPEDALGVIARGKQIVVVGDPKQLPPTSFFDRTDSDDVDNDLAAIIQTDSILDAVSPLFKMRRLRWHYRSQHESLIAYSNKNFYNNDLIVFPSPNAESDQFGIKFTFIEDSRFINNINKREAMVIADAVVEHALHHPDESLGIVAMNDKQSELIESVIEYRCKHDASIGNAIYRLRRKDSAEPLFIKNLENVQGDERDVIFISFTYGPGEVESRVYQRFGPINSDVGWRRLNVLFTRSKKRMHIFSSLKSEDILISETTKLGVRALKGFLHFAEKGNMKGMAISTGKSPDSDFEVAVINTLSKYGFECEPQVGVAGFFIDIAVRDPGNPGRYLMGIECDGATYHSAKSARDRDRLRQEILENLGWTIRRIWSTDWFGNPEGAINPIIRELNKLKTAVSENKVPLSDIAQQDENTIKKIVESSDSLRDKLTQFGQEVIDVVYPDISAEHRLLRPAMIEALIEHQPISRREFVERIPEYLRKGTKGPIDKKYLDKILELIENYKGSDINSMHDYH
ncbi:DUF4011 domain-containing protein [Orbaceae bacterium ESL0727]|nr:DUF4011 domain-containing protein [Orbaceae bacterium ESL0727]